MTWKPLMKIADELRKEGVILDFQLYYDWLNENPDWRVKMNLRDPYMSLIRTYPAREPTRLFLVEIEDMVSEYRRRGGKGWT